MYIYIYIYTHTYVLYYSILHTLVSLLRKVMSCDIHTHTPAQKCYTSFILHPFVT